MLTSKEMQHEIDDEILVDCYDEDEVSMSWCYYMQKVLNFPFQAKAKLRKRAGGSALVPVSVVALAADEEGFRGKDFDLDIQLGEYIVKIAYAALSHIKADEQTSEAFAIWKYWIRDKK